MTNPIGFSIHESLIVKDIPTKTKLLAHIIPGKLDTYIFKTQEEYNKDYQNSFFAITSKKAGWDCFRHYEILANGCIPLFLNLANIPPNIMTFFPKKIISETNQLYEEIKDKNFNDINKDYKEKLLHYISILVEHTRTFLTTRKMATYIFETAGISIHPENEILFLSGDILPDYLRCLTLIGCKELFGEKCHDFPKIPHIYKDYLNSSNLYGKGINYTKLIDPSCHTHHTQEEIISNIQLRKYKAVIYGSIHRGNMLLDIVSQYYKPIVLCGEDSHDCSFKNNKSFTFFLREFE